MLAELKAYDEAGRASMQRELEEAKARMKWYRAAHLLVADEFAFVGKRSGDDIRGIFLANDQDYNPLLYVFCSDTFAWACADAERAEYADAEALLKIAVEDGWVGLIRWVQEQRQKGCASEEPLEPVRKMMANHDAMKARIAELEAELADLEDHAEKLAEESGRRRERIAELEASQYGAAVEALRDEDCRIAANPKSDSYELHDLANSYGVAANWLESRAKAPQEKG
jgi:hypothetical protein